MAMSPRSERIQKQADLDYDKACKEAVEEVAFESEMEKSSEDEDEDKGPTLKKRLRQLDKKADLQKAKKEVRTTLNNIKKTHSDHPRKIKDKVLIEEVAKKLAHWKRRALKANKELRHIKRECSCGRAVNCPWICRK